MPKFKTWSIPDDYDEQATEWVTVAMCVPNTRKWRAIVSGSIYNLTRGRNWDRQTGTIKTAQDIGRRIWESITMDCSNNWDRIATALESVDAKIPNLLTLQEFLDTIDDSPILATLAEWVDLATIVDQILPNIDLRLTPVEWIRFFFDFRWKRGIRNAADSIASSLRLMMLAETGETVAEGAETIDGILDNVSDWASILVQGGTLGAEIAQAYAQLSGLYSDGFGDEDIRLRNYNRIMSDILINNKIEVDTGCCSGGGSIGNVNGSQTITPYSGGPGGGPLSDASPSLSVPVSQDKCNMTSYIIDQYIAYLRSCGNIFSAVSISEATAFTLWLNSTPLIFSSLAIAGAVLVLFGYVIGLFIAGLPLGVVLLAYANNLEGDKQSVVCDIMDLAASPSDVRSILSTWMTNNLPVDLPSSWVSYHIEHLFPNNVVNEIFEQTWDIGQHSFDCSPCDPPTCQGTITRGTGLPSCDVGSEFVLQGAFITGNYGPVYGIYFNYPNNIELQILEVTNYQRPNTDAYENSARVCVNAIGSPYVWQALDIPSGPFTLDPGRGFMFHSLLDGLTIKFKVLSYS